MSDPVLDAYVKRYGEQPSRAAAMERMWWEVKLNIWRAAWQEATLIEREACAVVCDEYFEAHDTSPVDLTRAARYSQERAEAADDLAAAIRARTKP